MTTHFSGFQEPSLDSAQSFRAIMNALARPGMIQTVSSLEGPAPLCPAMVATVLTLIDHTTSVYLDPSWDSPALRQWLAFHTGASLVAAEDADFALGTLQGLGDLTRFPKGIDAYPDRGCTLVVQQAELANSGARLTGPGIQTEEFINVPNHADWSQVRGPYPLGLDVFFVAADQIIGLPRSIQVEF
jgi:alpha-D-ribose 1-methylphosphonate 5-triphosphate synthase subunit PhnH